MQQQRSGELIESADADLMDKSATAKRSRVIPAAPGREKKKKGGGGGAEINEERQPPAGGPPPSQSVSQSATRGKTQVPNSAASQEPVTNPPCSFVPVRSVEAPPYTPHPSLNLRDLTHPG
jgi:hypothetical protein